MKHILLILFLLFTTTINAADFMSAFEEIPLQQGLTEDTPLTYDTEELRIIEQYVSSDTLTEKEFIDFYKQTLKSLGWELKKSSDNTLIFEREDETLNLTLSSKVPLVVLFSLQPKKK